MRIADVVNIPEGAERIVLAVRVVTRASRTEYVGTMDDGSHRIRLAAVPEDGRANLELRRYLAGEFGVRPDAVEVVSGASSTKKLVRIRTSLGE